MSPPAKKVALHAALVEQDDAVLGAVLNASPMLSGMSAEELEMFRARWRQQRHGADVDPYRTAYQGHRRLRPRRGSGPRYTSQMSDDHIVAEAEKSEAAVTEALKS